MSKKSRKYDNTARQQENMAGPCVMCPELLKIGGREQKTKVYATRGNLRYCVCLNCSHTWKRVIVIETKG